jgi:hypothetical protein
VKLTRKDIQFIAIYIGAVALVVIAAHFLWPPDESEAHLDEVVELAKYSYVASVNSEVFQWPDCRSAKQIAERNLIGFKTREDVVNSGRGPCEVCGP